MRNIAKRHDMAVEGMFGTTRGHAKRQLKMLKKKIETDHSE